MPPIPDQLSPFERGFPADDRYLTAKQVRARYGDVSDMWLWRRLKDDSRFPKPIEICRRRYWRLSDLLVWERSRASAA
jgi:predicted DNA-binding transcriptional regulator AlpA